MFVSSVSQEEHWYLRSSASSSSRMPRADLACGHQLDSSLFFTHSFSSRAKVAAADGPPGIPTQTLIPVKHTIKLDKDALLQDYGFHISESLPLTVVAVTAGRTDWEASKEFGLLNRRNLVLFPSLCAIT